VGAPQQKVDGVNAKVEASKPADKSENSRCDAVSCVLNNDEGACCAKLKENARKDHVDLGLGFVPCDAAKFKKKGEDYLSSGFDNAALGQFELSLQCKHDAGVVKLAYMAACRARSEPKATLYFGKIPAAQQSALLQLCVRMGVDPTK
jgi:hypothetical protein